MTKKVKIALISIFLISSYYILGNCTDFGDDPIFALAWFLYFLYAWESFILGVAIQSFAFLVKVFVLYFMLVWINNKFQ